MGRFFDTHAAGTLDPPDVRNWRIHFIALTVSFSALAMGYDTSVIGGTMALDSFRRDFGLDEMSQVERDTIQGNIVSTFQAGCFFGALLTFPLCEKIGRKWTIALAALIFLLGGALQTAAQNLSFIYGGRAVAGLGIGASSLCVPVYIAETAPPSIRGRLVGLFEVCSQGGGMLGFWINYATDQTITAESKAQWIVPLAIQLIPGVGLLSGIAFCPESPRWLARGDNFEAAEKTLCYIRGLGPEHEYIQREMGEIRAQVQERSTNRMSKRDQLKKMLSKGVRNRLGLGMALMFLQSFTGTNILSYYAPRVFETLGVQGTSLKLFSTGLYGFAKTGGMLIFTFYVAESLGRRNGMVWGSALGMIPMFYLGGYVLVANPAAAAEGGEVSRDGWGYLAMVCVYIHAVIINATIQGISWLYASEIFPLDLRMACIACTTATTWLGSFIIARSTPYMISDLQHGAFFFFASILFCMIFWSFFFIPETKGITLEEMDALFQKPTHRAVWAQLRGRPIISNRPESITDEKETVKQLEKSDSPRSPAV